MLQRISDGLRGQKWLAWLVLGAIALVFVAWGATGIVSFEASQSTYAAKVNGTKIPVEEATRAWSERQTEWTQQFRTEMPAAERPAQQDAVMERLIVRTLLQQRVDERGFRVSDDRLKQAMQQEQAFQVDGRFDPQLAKARLAQIGMSPEAYEAEKRQALQLSQLQDGIRVSHFMTAAELKRVLDLQSQEREVSWVVLPVEKFASTAAIDDAAIQAYYDKNRDQFLTTESVSLEFAELRLEAISSQVTPSEEDLRKLYESDKNRFVQPERRRARHILFQAADDAAAPEALKKAEQALADVRAGKDFATVAKERSQDAGSAPQGGDLGWAERGQFVGPFEDAIFSMKADEIRGPVKTQFGYHVIKLEGIEPGKTKSFEDARLDLSMQARAGLAADEFGNRQEAIQQRLESPGVNLDALAKDLGLLRGSVAQFLRGGGGEPLGSSQELQDVVFSDAALSQRRVVGPVALGEDRLVVLRVTEHRPAKAKPLAEVREQVIAKLRAEQGAAAAMAQAQEALKSLAAGSATVESLATGWGLKAEPKRFVGRGDPSIPAGLRTAVFDALKPQAGAPRNEVAKLDDGGVALFQLTQIRPNSAQNPELTKQLGTFLASRAGVGDLVAYLEEMRRQAKVDKNARVFEQ
jgi:peptidyl-prolyl cis-trans isomerase D